MKQQKHDDTALYRELRGAFEMSPGQKKRVEQEIRRRAAAEKTVTVQTADDGFAETDAGTRSIFGGYWYAVRMIPLAACLVLVCAGAFFLHRGLTDPADSGAQQSSIAVEEQITLPETEPALSIVTTAGTAASAQTGGIQTDEQTAAQSQASAVGSRTTAAQTAAETQAASKTTTVKADVTEHTTAETAAQTTTAQTTTTQTTTAQTTTTQTTTAQTTTTQTTTTQTTTVQTTTVQTTTENEPEWRKVSFPEEANIVIRSAEGAPGDLVKIEVVAAADFTAAGLQLDFCMEQNPCDIGPYPVGINADQLDAILKPNGDNTVLNYFEDDMEFLMTFGLGRDVGIPAGTVLLTVEFRIPKDMQTNQRYLFMPAENGKCKMVSAEDVSDDLNGYIPLRICCGSLSVTV